MIVLILYLLRKPSLQDINWLTQSHKVEEIQFEPRSALTPKSMLLKNA